LEANFQIVRKAEIKEVNFQVDEKPENRKLASCFRAGDTF